MLDSLLIAYASRAGSTAGVAEFMAGILRDKGAAVDVQPVDEITDLAPYSAVVIGSAIQDRQWLPEAVQFVQCNQQLLSQKPTAMFSLCMTLAMRNGEQYRPQVAQWTAPVRALIHPVSENHFAGVFDISKIPSFSDRVKFRLSVLFRVWSEGDHRDWDQIRSWTEQLYNQL